MEEGGEDVDQDDDGEGEDKEAVLPVVSVHLNQDKGGREEEDDQSERPDQPWGRSEPVSKQSIQDKKSDIWDHGGDCQVRGELDL